MSAETLLIARLRALARHPAGRDLLDDAAVLDLPAGQLVATHDMLVEGVHYLPTDPPADVAWKLVAVNLSDLAAKGATPVGVLLGYTLGDADWDAAFVEGLGEALMAFDAPLLGGDTVAGPGPRTLSLTALGRAPAAGAPDRRGARPGDALWVTGTIGDAGLGLAIARGGEGPGELLARYRRPSPRLAAGRALAPQVTAMMDVSDGLLLDASRMAEASSLAVTIDLARVPPARLHRAERLAAATAGDDYELLFACAPDMTPDAAGLAVTRIGGFAEGAGLTLLDDGVPVPLPASLGWRHG